MAGRSSLPLWCQYMGGAPTMLMLVPSQQSESQGPTQPLNVYASVFACPRFVSTMPPRLDAEQQGNPKATRFSSSPSFFCDVFRPPLLPPPVVFFFFGLLALGMNPVTEFLGHFRLNGFYGMTGNRFIPLHSCNCRITRYGTEGTFCHSAVFHLTFMHVCVFFIPSWRGPRGAFTVARVACG